MRPPTGRSVNHSMSDLEVRRKGRVDPNRGVFTLAGSFLTPRLNSGKRPPCGFAKFDSTGNNGNGPLDPFCEKRRGKHRGRYVENENKRRNASSVGLRTYATLADTPTYTQRCKMVSGIDGMTIHTYAHTPSGSVLLCAEDPDEISTNDSSIRVQC